MPTVRKIATAPRMLARKKVAAYARVSVDEEAPLHSLSAQVSYYSSLIQTNPEWEYAGVYADAGITGTSIAPRDEFKRLIADCEAGKIDIVLVKSVSRFARDTVDCLDTTRHLKNMGVAVYFERERINSLSGDGELLLTLLASFAQEESRSISGNIKWATRKRFEEGIPNGHKSPYGYSWGGEMFNIVPERGEIVKEIYRRYLEGESVYSIAKTLAASGVTGQAGHPIEQSAVKEILSNLSYTGTMALQKYFQTESHTRRKNRGELPMYLVDEMFEPMVSEAEYQAVQELRRQRAEQYPNNRNCRTIFSGKIKCGYCGRGISRRTSSGRKRWVCNTRERKGMSACACRPLWESELESATAKALQGDVEDSTFAREISMITVYNDRIEFTGVNGICKSISREYNGHRGQNAFTNKVWCGTCGCKCERDTYNTKKIKVWRCSQLRTRCRMRRLAESELLETTAKLLGDNYPAKVAAEIKRIVICDDHIVFEHNDGKVITCQRK